MYAIRASARHLRAIHSTAELLAKLRIESIFVGSVARAAWLGDCVEQGSVDVLALLNAPQKNQVAMMASHRGFRVERAEIEESELLDLVPLNFVDPAGDVRVHVLLASNALYGRMVAAGVAAPPSDALPALRVPRAEDLALLLLLAEDDEGVQRLSELPQFDRRSFDDRLASIGLGARVGGR